MSEFPKSDRSIVEFKLETSRMITDVMIMQECQAPERLFIAFLRTMGSMPIGLDCILPMDKTGISIILVPDVSSMTAAKAETSTPICSDMEVRIVAEQMVMTCAVLSLKTIVFHRLGIIGVL